MLHKKSSGVDKNKLMLHDKVFYVDKKIDVGQKGISCRQKQVNAG